MARHYCVICRDRPARLIELPLTGRRLWLCRVCGAGRVIASMRELIAHG